MNFQNLSVENFEQEVNNPDITIIDVRTPAEHKEFGIIEGADLFINSSDIFFRFKIGKLDKSKKYGVYCWHGNRSKAVQQYMKNQGFTYVSELDKGIDEWNKKK